MCADVASGDVTAAGRDVIFLQTIASPPADDVRVFDELYDDGTRSERHGGAVEGDGKDVERGRRGSGPAGKRLRKWKPIGVSVNYCWWSNFGCFTFDYSIKLRSLID